MTSKIPPLFKHQAEFLKKNPAMGILAWEAGIGKTRASIEWLTNNKAKNPLIICTKAIKTKWKEDLIKWGYTGNYVLLTKEEFKKNPKHENIDRLIVDEAHNFSSPLFVAKLRSQLSTDLYKFIQANPNIPRLLLTANPVRSSPSNLHTMLVFAGVGIEWPKWQKAFFHLVRRPYLPRPAWEPKIGWQKRMIPIIDKYCHVSLMSDSFDVPVQEHTYIDIKLTKRTRDDIKELGKEEWEPMKLWCGEHRLENGEEKLKWIKNFSKGRKKMVIICKYTDQIKAYAKALEKDRETFVLSGQVKDQGAVIKSAQESPECFIIVQAQVSAGYDLDQFSTMIFASPGWSWVDYSQAKGRINRAHNLHRNEYYHLIAGPKDKAIIDSLEDKKDFDVSQIKK